MKASTGNTTRGLGRIVAVTSTGEFRAVAALAAILIFANSALAVQNIAGFSVDPTPDVGALSYDIIVSGNATGINTADGFSNLGYSAFADPYDDANPSLAGESATYDSLNNTSTISFYGGPILSLPPGITDYFGVDNFGNQNSILHEYWDFGDTHGPSHPGWTGGNPSFGGEGPTTLVMVSADVTGITGTDRTFLQIPIDALGPAPALVFVNGEFPVTLSNVGYFFSPSPFTPVSLSSTPAPGQPGSPFTALPSLDGLSMSPNQTIAGVAVPEPGSLSLLLAGVLFAGLARRRRYFIDGSCR